MNPKTAFRILAVGILGMFGSVLAAAEIQVVYNARVVRLTPGSVVPYADARLLSWEIGAIVSVFLFLAVAVVGGALWVDSEDWTEVGRRNRVR